MSSLLTLLKKNTALPMLGFVFLTTLFTMFGGAFVASAATVDPENLSAKIVNDRDRPDEAIANTDIRQGLVSVINYFLAFLGLLAVAYIIYAGVIMLTGEGEDASITKARKIIIYATIGIVIIFLSWTIVNFVADIPGTVDTQNGAAN